MTELTNKTPPLIIFLSTDAVTVVLYHLFESLSLFDEITYKEVWFGIKDCYVQLTSFKPHGCTKGAPNFVLGCRWYHGIVGQRTNKQKLTIHI